MNHSCCPNVIVTYKGTLAEVRAVQEIHPGEEVSVWLQVAVAVGAPGLRTRFPTCGLKPALPASIWRSPWPICGQGKKPGKNKFE